MEEKLIEKTKTSINQILEGDISPNNIEYLYKLSKINHMAKEDNNMYGNYMGRNPGYDTYGRGSYGNYGNYGARGYDSKYRGEENLNRMYNEYGRYMETRERYGAGEESDKAFHFMTKALGEYLDFLHEEADTPQKKQMLNETLQRSMR